MLLSPVVWCHYFCYKGFVMKALFFLFFLLTSMLSATTWEVDADGTSASTSGSNYDNDMDISTTLSIDGVSGLKVTITGETEAYYDFLYIRNSDSITKSFHGVLNEVYYIQGSSVFLQFLSDSSVTESGVTVTIEEYTGTTYNSGTVYNYGVLPFNLINPSDTQNIIGDSHIIGNTVECVTKTQYASSSDYSNLECDDTVGNYNNNNYTVKYHDIDGDSSTYNSSSATIELPNTFKEIAWVGLFWQAHINNNSVIYKIGNHKYYSSDYPAGGIESTNANKVKLKLDNGTYHEIIANQVNYFNSTSYARYSAFADITSEFTSVYNAGSNITITVGDILASQGLESGLGNYGAWTLVVVYKEDELNPVSKLRNNSVYLGYQYVSSGSGEREINLTNFILPKTGTIDSQMAVFAAEGEYRYEPDTMRLDSTTLGDPDQSNVFDARLSDFIRNPHMTNNDGIDIDVFDTSAIMTTKRDADPNAISYNATIYLTSEEDLYYPSMVSFTTELYRPRVCYYIDTIKDSNGTAIFEDKGFVGEVTANEEYTFDLTIANMRASLSDGIQDANLVQIYMKMTNLDYTAESTSIKNSLETIYNAQNDAYTTSSADLGDYNTTNTTSNWRLGIDASNVDGGKLVSVDSLSDANNAHILFNGEFTVDENATNIDLLNYLEFKASFRVDGLVITPENASLIVQCVDLNTSGTIAAAPAGAFNVVQTSFSGSTDPLDPAAVENRLPTQVSGRAFSVKVVSLEANNITLTSYVGDVNVSIIPTPAYTGVSSSDQALCDGASPYPGTTQVVNMGGLSSKDITVTNTTQAVKSASFKITYNLSSTPASVCSRDVFAIRPDKFILTPPAGEDIELLTSATVYNLTLNAVQDASITPTQGYNLTNANTIITVNGDKYKPDGTLDNGLIGSFSFSNTPFNVVNGISDNGAGNSEVVGISFDDVAMVNIKLQDQTWAQIDLDNGDTVADCSANGAYICGDVNATFIPDHFALSAVTLNNYSGSTFTYLSNDLNISAALEVTLTAENSANTKTQNFDTASWENDVNASFTLPVPAIAGMVEDKNEITTPIKLGFTTGDYTILQNEPDSAKNLIFNYNRTVNDPKNPFKIDGTAVNIAVSSLYTSSSGATKNVSGTAAATQDATFVYGRTHAPRQRFAGNNGTVNIYYENFCDGAGCDKSLLPNGVNSTSSDDPRWFINTSHFVTAGSVGVISQKNGANDVTAAAAAGVAPATSNLTFNSAATKGYPFKTTMENNASTWLIYNKYNAGATTNEFEVEFTDAQNSWAGQHETNTTTNFNASQKTNRRTMW